MTNSIASRLDHYKWPDGSVSPGTPIWNYAQACAVYESRRRASGSVSRVCLCAAQDGLGYTVTDIHNTQYIRATPGNVYPHPGDVEYQSRGEVLP